MTWDWALPTAFTVAGAVILASELRLAPQRAFELRDEVARQSRDSRSEGAS